MSTLSMADMASRTKPMVDKPKKKKKWVKAATEKAGVFKAKAESAGESTREFASEHKDDAGKTGKQARLAATLMQMSKKKRSPLYDNPRSKKD